MNKSAAFLPGRFPNYPGPLSRFLPPLPTGVGSLWLSENIPPGSWVIDPFGASPRLLGEVALAGYRVLVAANNPISRFLIDLYADPPSEEELRAALADLAVDPKSGERVEHQIRTLYETDCSNCGRLIEAQAFIWERDSNTLVGKIYTCPACKDSGERQASAADIQRLAQHTGISLHKSRALERVAALNDPDRGDAEEALSIYPARAVYALFKLINRLDLLSENKRHMASALLLAAFDQSNGMWHYPITRFRPKQLGLPAHYLEKNVWLALEEAVVQWPPALISNNHDSGQIPLTIWPQIPEHQGICIFEGRLKDLVGQIKSDKAPSIHLAAYITAIPRPNQAFWTLSALWAGWLWGKTASAAFKSVLRRRRYDWSWHFVALSSAFSNLRTILEVGVPGLGLIGEAEPGFISAAVLAAALSGFSLKGIGIRNSPEQAEIFWEAINFSKVFEENLEIRQHSAGEAIFEFLRMNGEPSTYLKVFTAGISAFAQSAAGVNNQLITSEINAETHRSIENNINHILAEDPRFVRLNATSRSLETGQWWLKKPYPINLSISSPLADRVEVQVVRLLQSDQDISLVELDTQICSEFGGLLTPDFDLIQQCLESYGELLPGNDDRWRLRPQDNPVERRRDLEEIQELIIRLGAKFGFETIVDKAKKVAADHPRILWKAAGKGICYDFYLTASGVLGTILLASESKPDQQAEPCHHLIVLPGGRAGLVEFKIRRDVRLRIAAEKEWEFLKFRHVRRLAEFDELDQSSLINYIKKDPLANRDPQMQLF